MKTTPKPSQIAMMAGGVVALIFSFFRFVAISNPFGGDATASAWSTDANLFPLATWPAIFGVIVAGTTAAILFADLKLPEPVLTFNWKQINFILSFAAVVIMIGYLFANANKGIGYWFMLLGVLAYTAGSVMELLGIEVGNSSTPDPNQPNQNPGGPSTPF